LKHLTEAIADGRLRGLARGVAYQLVERFGVLDRRAAEEHIRALSRSERRILKSFGVRFGAFSLYLPALLTAEALAIGAVFAHLAAPRWRPAPGKLNVLPSPAPPTEALSLRGLAAVAGLAIPVMALETFDAMARAAPSGSRPDLIELTPTLLAVVGWTAAQADAILRSLGFVRVKKAESAEASLWRRRPFAPRPPAPARPPATPEPILARAAPPATATAQKRRRRRPRHRSTPAAPGTTA
jgi:ATP-dependent RNA helicase SUPV3L1/SUV3